jgi:hypothetical protein
MKITYSDVNNWNNAKPFNYLVIDNFLEEDLANKIALDFPSADSDFWYEYHNPIEIKKACSDWNKFPPSIYSVLSDLLSPEVNRQIELLTQTRLYPDYGLHGGGLHCHKQGGKLNTHLDYSIHPKLKTERKINIILYVTKDWNPEWGGSLGLWSHDDTTNQPKDLIKSIDCIFNRAVIFDTTKNSWHGLPDAVKCPEGISRNSLAVYYTRDPVENADDRNKALFAPSKDQENDDHILEIIKKRSNVNQASSVYKV